MQELIKGQPSKAVLLVDDDEVTRYLLGGALAKLGFRVLEARGGREAISQIEREAPDAVILDIAMPDMNGFEVLRHIRDSKLFRLLPVIVHSSREFSDGERKLISGSQAFLYPKRASRPEDASSGLLENASRCRDSGVSSGKDTILVVDDRPANRYATVHALVRSGFKVMEAQSGREALELAKQVPAAILLDVKLPDILGYEVCRRIKSNPRTSHIPVLQLSAAFADNESRVYALDSGADAYLTQPVEPNVLVATVRSLVKLHEAESRAQIASKQWQATFDALGEGVAIVDPSGVVQRCNRAMTELLRRPYIGIEGHGLDQLLQDALHLNLPDESAVGPLEVFAGSQWFRLNLETVLSRGGNH